jgi:AFG3 family protein
MVGSVDSLERQLEDAQYDLGITPRNFVPVQFVTETNWASEFIKLAPHIAILGVLSFAMYKMGGSLGQGGGMGGMGGGGGKGGKNIFSVGKSTATLVKAEETKGISFKDVAGLDEAKVEVMEFVQFLKDPDVFTSLGAKIPKGALLVGPPGTGKTMLAKAVAGEASVPFYSISGSDFIEMFVGVGPARVRDLFEKAREDAPCIIFIDEIDAVGRARSKAGAMGGNDERENTLNQLLVEMDGFNPSEGVVVLAGTNRADILDAALLRPGRFDRQINIDKPDILGREQIFRVHLKGKKLANGGDVAHMAKRMAALTPGFAGADIANIANEGALIAARNNKDGIELKDFEKAVDRVIGGLEKSNSVMSFKERELVAYHEAGHAVAGWFLEHADPLLKVTIVPRGNGALGFAQYLPKELSLYQTEQLVDMICMALGGRCAEQLFFGKISTGASDDLKKVTNIAYAQATVYGMSAKLGNVSYQQDEGDSQFQKPYSEATAKIIDEEVSTMVQSSYNRTMALLTEHKDLVAALAKKLLEVETVSHDDIVAVLGDRKYSTPAYLEYVKNSRSAKEPTPKAEVAEEEEGIKMEPAMACKEADIVR